MQDVVVKQVKDQSEYFTPENLESLAEFEKWDAANGYQRTRVTVEDLRKKVEAIKLKRAVAHLRENPPSPPA
jgi:hypothetical protein